MKIRQDFNRKLLILLLASILFSCSTNPQERNEYQEKITKETEEAIKNDTGLKEFDDLCKEIPVMEGFKYVSKSLLKKKKLISFYYDSTNDENVDFVKLKKFYISYMEGKGWKPIAEYDFGSKWVEFKKDDKYILISTASDKSMNFGKTYAISCKDYSYSMIE